MKLSILMPVYNGRRYLEDALPRIAKQMTPEHELVIVDDGSTDGSAEIIRAFRERFPDLDISCIGQANQGTAAARNALLRQARGEYLLFVDSDDLLLPEALARLEAGIGQYRPEVVMLAFEYWEADHPEKSGIRTLSFKPDALLTAREDILLPYFFDGALFTWNAVCRRDVWARLGDAPFPVGRLFEDAAVMPSLMARARSVVYLPFPLLSYRQHPLSAVRAVTRKWCEDYLWAWTHNKDALAGAPDSARLMFDMQVCLQYVNVFKHSFRLPCREGGEVRENMRKVLEAGLLTSFADVLAGLEGRDSPAELFLGKKDRASYMRKAGQLRKILGRDPLFRLRVQAGMKWRQWRHRRRAERARAV